MTTSLGGAGAAATTTLDAARARACGRRRAAAWTALLMLAACAGGCTEEKTVAEPLQPVTVEGKPVVKVKVTRDGRIELDGRPATIEELRSAFHALHEKGGVVLYHREDPGAPATPASKAVMLAIAFESLPVKLCPEDFQ